MDLKDNRYLCLGSLQNIQTRKHSCLPSNSRECVNKSFERTVLRFEESVKKTYFWPVDNTRPHAADGILYSHTCLSP